MLGATRCTIATIVYGGEFTGCPSKLIPFLSILGAHMKSPILVDSNKYTEIHLTIHLCNFHLSSLVGSIEHLLNLD